MLAALLCNLPELYATRDADAGKKKRVVYYTRQDREQALLEAADSLESMLTGESAPEAAKPLQKAVKRLKTYSQGDMADANEISSLLAELSMREFEIRQEMRKSNQEQMINHLLILEQLSVFLVRLQDDQEAILVLLLAE